MKAIAFHASVRLRLKNMGSIKVKFGGVDRIVGIKVRCQVVKNRMGPPLRSADFDIFFDRGIDNYGALLSSLKENGLIKQGGAYYTYQDPTGAEPIKFMAKEMSDLMDARPDVKDDIYNKICAATIRQYKTGTTYDEDDLTVGGSLTEDTD